MTDTFKLSTEIDTELSDLVSDLEEALKEKQTALNNAKLRAAEKKRILQEKNYNDILADAKRFLAKRGVDPKYFVGFKLQTRSIGSRSYDDSKDDELIFEIEGKQYIIGTPCECGGFRSGSIWCNTRINGYYRTIDLCYRYGKLCLDKLKLESLSKDDPSEAFDIMIRFINDLKIIVLGLNSIVGEFISWLYNRTKRRI